MSAAAPVVITGASGLIGTRLRAALRARGTPLRLISRAARIADEAGEEWLAWADLPRAVRGAAAIVNLAGEPVAGRRWTAAVKATIRDSRVSAGQAVVAALRVTPAEQRPRTLVQASAVGYYGSRGDALLDETSEPGDDYLAEVCRAWEDSSCGAEELGVRRVTARIGLVLAPEGGALRKMLAPFRLGVGGRLGDGRQWMPWIHADDAIAMLLAMLDDPRWNGPGNLCSPDPLPNSEFTRALGRALHRPAVLPMPEFALRLLLGEGADPLLQSQRAVPALARRLDFRFGHPALDAALADLLKR
ncbi:MAG: TIGR01777 family oxidoreductase [Planctomycetota bacterium]|nr:TIGR01777 family oxidoreductase [Planctomycetota bacterium]